MEAERMIDNQINYWVFHTPDTNKYYLTKKPQSSGIGPRLEDFTASSDEEAIKYGYEVAKKHRLTE